MKLVSYLYYSECDISSANCKYNGIINVSNYIYIDADRTSILIRMQAFKSLVIKHF